MGVTSSGVACVRPMTTLARAFVGEKVAIKKITNVFDHVSDATRILREIKLLRLLRHPGDTMPSRMPKQPRALIVVADDIAAYLEIALTMIDLHPVQISWRSSTSCCLHPKGSSRTFTLCLS